MEYDELVNYYRQRLQERYREIISRPEWNAILERLRNADEETRRKVMELLSGDKNA